MPQYTNPKLVLYLRDPRLVPGERCEHLKTKEPVTFHNSYLAFRTGNPQMPGYKNFVYILNQAIKKISESSLLSFTITDTIHYGFFSINSVVSNPRSIPIMHPSSGSSLFITSSYGSPQQRMTMPGEGFVMIEIQVNMFHYQKHDKVNQGISRMVKEIQHKLPPRHPFASKLKRVINGELQSFFILV